VLRRAENASVSFRPRLFSKKGIVDFIVGSRTAAIAMMTSEEFEGIQRQQLSYPARVCLAHHPTARCDEDEQERPVELRDQPPPIYGATGCACITPTG